MIELYSPMRIVGAVALAIVALPFDPADAEPCTASSPSLTPTGCIYDGSTAQWRFPVPSGEIRVGRIALGSLADRPGGTFDSFFDIFFEIDIPAPPAPPQQVTGPATGGSTSPNPVSPPLPPIPAFPAPGVTIPIELVQLELHSATPIPLIIRESPTRPSQGQGTLTDLGGGSFRIDSFFDVFTELSIDGGQSFIPSLDSVRLTLRRVPEPASAALLSLGGALALAAAARRRRATG